MAGQQFQYDDSGNTFFYFLTSFVGLIVIPATYYLWPRDQHAGERPCPGPGLRPYRGHCLPSPPPFPRRPPPRRSGAVPGRASRWAGPGPRPRRSAPLHPAWGARPALRGARRSATPGAGAGLGGGRAPVSRRSRCQP